MEDDIEMLSQTGSNNGNKGKGPKLIKQSTLVEAPTDVEGAFKLTHWV